MSQMFHLEVFLPCSPAMAFALFTEEKRLEDWLTAKAHVEPRVGGLFELFWAPDDRENDSTIGCRFTAFEPGKLVAFDWRSPRQFKPFANAVDPLTHVTVFLKPHGEGTEVHLVHSGWRTAPEWQEACAWQRRAWTMALTGLQESLRA